jgi:hypothetical protein
MEDGRSTPTDGSSGWCLMLVGLRSSGSAATAFHVATLLALLRVGEQSAICAFNRIAGRMSAGELQLAAPRLTALICDEQRHDHVLAAHCATLPHVVVGDAMTRRFFRGLESRESTVHLARVAALDACVCQVLTRVLAPTQRKLGDSLVVLLSRIRCDEARHVRTARGCAAPTPGCFSTSMRTFATDLPPCSMRVRRRSRRWVSIPVV